LPDIGAYYDFLWDEYEPLFDGAKGSDSLLTASEYADFEEALYDKRVRDFGDWEEFSTDSITAFFDAFNGLDDDVDGISWSDYKRVMEVAAIQTEDAAGSLECPGCNTASSCECTGTAYYYSSQCSCCSEDCDSGSSCECTGTAYYYSS